MSEQKVPRSVEQRIVIKFPVGENVPSAEIHHRLQQQYGEECLRRRWFFSGTDMNYCTPNFGPPCVYILIIPNAQRKWIALRRNTTKFMNIYIICSFSIAKIKSNHRIIFYLYFIGDTSVTEWHLTSCTLSNTVIQLMKRTIILRQLQDQNCYFLPNSAPTKLFNNSLHTFKETAFSSPYNEE